MTAVSVQTQPKMVNPEFTTTRYLSVDLCVELARAECQMCSRCTCKMPLAVKIPRTTTDANSIVLGRRSKMKNREDRARTIVAGSTSHWKDEAVEGVGSAPSVEEEETPAAAATARRRLLRLCAGLDDEDEDEDEDATLSLRFAPLEPLLDSPLPGNRNSLTAISTRTSAPCKRKKEPMSAASVGPVASKDGTQCKAAEPVKQAMTANRRGAPSLRRGT